jgi:hypothetical protein
MNDNAPSFTIQKEGNGNAFNRITLSYEQMMDVLSALDFAALGTHNPEESNRFSDLGLAIAGLLV